MVNDKLRQDITVCALILSAGYSSRMGDFKPLLKVGDVPAIGRIADAFREAGVNQILAVTGYKRELLKPILKEKGIEEAYNKDFCEGMYESVKTGIRAAMAKPSVPLSAYLLLPVDCPLVPAKIINRIVQEHKKHPESFIVPCYHGKKGHPLLIPSIYEGEILAYNGERGLKAVTTRHEDKMLRIE
ncbi:MAG: nucleotidyltransferase family protein, partial [Eubacteriales bacterium]|nr:nucleotidyltransferase family protein [Eubacteriales bacterium]